MTIEARPSFTPGPWQWCHYNGRPRVAASSRNIADILMTNRRVDGSDANADANLIAAAPEMYEALKMAKSALDELVTSEFATGAIFEAYEFADAALAKAEGKR